MFEYKTIKIGSHKMEKELNAYAKEGWRVIQVVQQILFGDGDGFLVILEREKKQEH